MRTLFIQHDHDGYPGALLEPLERAGSVQRWDTFTHPARPDLDGIDAIVSLGGTAHPDQDHAEPWLAAELDLLEEALDVGIPVGPLRHPRRPSERHHRGPDQRSGPRVPGEGLLRRRHPAPP